MSLAFFARSSARSMRGSVGNFESMSAVETPKNGAYAMGGPPEIRSSNQRDRSIPRAPCRG